jgi:hypothetical protein
MKESDTCLEIPKFSVGIERLNRCSERDNSSILSVIAFSQLPAAKFHIAK